MEIKRKIIQNIVLWIIPLSIILLICACRFSKRERISFQAVYASEHTLMALSPNFTIRTTGTTLHKQYPQLGMGKKFPMIGVLRVNGKSYRFMGGDSLRIVPLAPIFSGDGWNGKYSYLYPGADWEKREYDDSKWRDGGGAFGTKNIYYPVHTLWGANNIYARRHITINDVDSLEGHKMYIRYFSDGEIKLYCNGEYISQIDNYTSQVESRQLDRKIIDQLRSGDNVFAVYGHCKEGGLALLDFGLYVENKKYSELDTATLKRMDVQATQTHYVYQCGDVELQLDFVSPGLLEETDMAGCPVSFITYKVLSEGKEPSDMEILFDADMGWSFDWFSVDMEAEEKEYSNENGHVILSQKLGRGRSDHGALLIGYDENRILQYEGESMYPSCNRGGEKTINDLMKSVKDKCWVLKKKCDEADDRFYEKAIRTGSQNCAEQVLPAYRNFMANHWSVVSPDNKFYCFGDTLGNVREAYSCFPTLLFFDRADLMKGLLNAVFETCENSDWVKSYPPYDIGTYPMSGRQSSIEDHSIEVAADMLLMTLAIVESENDFDYAEKHWRLLQQWAVYLEACIQNEPTFPSELLNGNDERVKKVLGWKAYQKLIQWRQNNG